MYLMKPSERAAELQDPGSVSRLELILAVQGDHTQFLFKLFQARFDLDVGNKLINFFFSLQKQTGPLKKKFKSHHRKPKKLKKATNGK